VVNFLNRGREIGPPLIGMGAKKKVWGLPNPPSEAPNKLTPEFKNLGGNTSPEVNIFGTPKVVPK